MEWFNKAYDDIIKILLTDIGSPQYVMRPQLQSIT